MSAADRKRQVSALMDHLFRRAKRGDFEFDSHTKVDLEMLFSTTVWGFRELLLVIAIARLLDSGYQASSNLYDSGPFRRPRAVYPLIRAKLAEHGIPHRKDGPLNIAKAAEAVNESWAAKRRPADVARVTVNFVRRVDVMPRDELEDFAVALHARLLQEASRVDSLRVNEAVPEVDPGRLYYLCEQLIKREPDAGNTPQTIAGLLLQAYHEELQTGLVVTGHADRASATSTTSKKPGDINEEQTDGTIVTVYEITVKAFGHERVIDSYETVKAYDSASDSITSEVIVICRAEDAHSSALGGAESTEYLGKLEHKDLTYHFVEIYGWTMAQIVRMPPPARLSFYQRLNDYISNPNTSEQVKLLWRKLNEPVD